MSDSSNTPEPGSIPPPGQPSFSPPPPPPPPPPQQPAPFGSAPPPYGAPTTPPPYGAPTTPPPYGAPTEPLYTQTGGFPPGPGASTSVVANPTPPRRSRGKMIGAIAGVAAVLAAGTFAFTQLRDNDSKGGAATPQDLGEQFVATLDDEDILGAIDLLLPGEQDTFRQPMIDLVDELTRLEITDDSADLSKVAGLDITITDAAIDVAETNVDDIAQISIQATSSVKVDGRDLPIGDFLIETVFGGDRPEIDEESDEEDFSPEFTAVKEQGRWYISLFYTAATSAVGDRDIPEEGIEPVGASSPEDALGNLIDYTSNLDVANMIASLNPNEAAALQRFAPLFIDDAQDELDQFDMTWEISNTTYSVTGSGDTRQVGIDGFHFEAQVEGETLEFDWADGCLIGTTPEGDFDSCAALEEANTTIDDALDSLGVQDSAPLKQLLEDVGEAFSDFSLNGIVVDKVDGSWYVSPIGTSFETLLSVLRALDRDEIETLINDTQDVIEGAFGGFSMPGIDDFPDDVPGDTVPADTFPDDTFPDDTVPVDSTTDDTIPTESASWYDCLDQFESPEQLGACITSGVADGTFAAEDIPAPFLFPQCGLLEYYNSDELFNDDADAFNATIDAGRQCILDAAGAAGVDISFTSPEFTNPECYLTDNPYNYEDDDVSETDGFTCVLES